MKFGVKFSTSFESSTFDWQLCNGIAKFKATLENFKRTSETVCQKFLKCSVTHCVFLKNIHTSPIKRDFFEDTPTPLEIAIPSVRGVWIFSGTVHYFT